MPPRGIGLGRGMRHLRYGSSHHGGLSYRPDVPLTLGHEPAGVVTEVNDTRDQTLLGRRVIPTLFVGCKNCEPCLSGDERLSERQKSPA